MSFSANNFFVCKLPIMKRIVFLILIGLMLCGGVVSQNKAYFKRITTDNGLSQSDINTIHQDKNGFMWFGTHDGLNRYDGYTFKVFQPEPKNPNSIPSNLIFDITEDVNGNLWIGTTGAGLVYFDLATEKFTTFKHDKDDVKSISSNSIAKVYVDRENRLWVGTSKGLNMVDLKESAENIEFKRFKAQQEPYLLDRNLSSIQAIYEDSNGQIWVGGYAGIYRLSRESNGDAYLRFVNKDIGLPNVAVRCITEYENRLLIGTSEGLFIQEKTEEKYRLKKVLQGSYNEILVNKNRIWAGTNEGLWEIHSVSNDSFEINNHFDYDPKNAHSISKNNVISLFRDKTGVIWAGTNGGGVNKFDPNRKQFQHIRKTLDPNSLSYDKIRSFFEDSNKNLWVGTEGGGLNLLQKHTNNQIFDHFNTIRNVYAIEEIELNNKSMLVFGGQGNPSMFLKDISDSNKIKNSELIPIDDFINSIFSLLKDSKGNLWVGTYNGGIYRWQINNRTSEIIKDNYVNDVNDPKSVSNNIIRNIFEDSYGNIWFGTSNGLSVLTRTEVDKKFPKFKNFKNDPKDASTISHNYILSVYEDSNKNVWVGTFGGGLNRFEGNGKEIFKSYNEKDGLPNNVVKGIIEDDEGFLWLSTNKGLSKFDPNNQTFKNYDVNDGLQSNEFQELAYLKRENGDILFGGVNGFNVFQPKTLRENTYLPETVITKLLVSNEEVEVGKEVKGNVLLKNTISEIQKVNLKHFQNNISFEFAALHYAAPEKNKFKYKLEGFDINWESTSANKRFAAYTNLAPGDYVFKVKSSNNDGLWNEEAAHIAISISPPFWMTWWAYAIYGLLILALFWSIQSYLNLRSKQRASVQLQKEIEQVNKLKLQFFTNISHEFKTPITLILNPIEELLASVQNNSTIQSRLKVVQRNANSLLRLVHQLMEFRRIEVGETKLGATPSNVVSFIREIAYSFQTTAKKKGINISFESKSKEIKTWFDWDKLEKIMNNLIFNAIKFTPEEGEIIVRVKESKVNDQMHIESRGVVVNYVQIEVQDNGVGMDRAQLPYVFHRFYQVDQSNKAAYEGSGIGLAITKDLVDLHHGEIEVDSQKGKGTTFKLKLPLGKTHLLPEEQLEINIPEPFLDNELDDLAIEEIAEAQNDYDIVDKDKNVILVVDDNTDIRELVKEGLRERYSILEAEHGREALNIALKEMPDLVISDVLMPEMDGVEFCRELKSNIRTSHIPVILLTALNSVEHRIEGIESGADAYIPKPFKMKLLMVRVKKLIASREMMRKRFLTEKELTPEKVTLNSVDEVFLNKIMDCMEMNMGNDSYWVDELASDMNVSRSTFFRKLKKLTGQSPNDFMRMIRLKRAVQLLEQNELTISQISYMVGFSDPGYFGKCFRKMYGVAPSNYLVKS